ncbi:MAG: SDR family oxidoreductase [Pseudomonadota bacterium]|nr:SDR family oxidoreductase [Pseudomonadota bacterium]
MSGLLQGLGAVVTAGAGGAGRVIAETLADAGAKVVTCDIDAAATTRLSAARPDILSLAGDVSDESTVHRIFDDAYRRLGRVDILVNNVGIAGPTATVEDLSTDDWQQSIRANLTSHFLCARRVIPQMKQRGSGLIVNISSASVKVGLPLRLPYIVTKGALLHFTTNLARELGPRGIRVNAILPGAIRGERIQRVIAAKATALGQSVEECERELLKYVSLRTMVDPADIAAMILFLASPAGARVTGQLIGVDGNIEYET